MAKKKTESVPNTPKTDATQKNALFDAIVNEGPAAGVELPAQSGNKGFYFVAAAGVVVVGLTGLTFYKTFQGAQLAYSNNANKQANAPVTLGTRGTEGWETGQKQTADQEIAHRTNPEPPNVGIILKGQEQEDDGKIDESGLTAEQKRSREAIRHGQNPNDTVATGNKQGSSGAGTGEKPKPHALLIDMSSYFNADGSLKSDKEADRAGNHTTGENNPVAPSLSGNAEDRAKLERSQQELAAWQKQQERGTAGRDKTEENEAPTKEPVFAEWDRYEGQLYRIFTGSRLVTRLLNKVSSSGAVTGPVVCQVIQDFYSHDFQRVLIPKGSIVTGAVQIVNALNQERAYVTFDTLLYPDGFQVSLNFDRKSFTGLDVEGNQGIRDLVNHHYLSTFGTTAALVGISAVSNLGVSGYGGYGGVSIGTQLRTNAGSELGQRAQQIFAQQIQRVPTFTLRPSIVIEIYFPTSALELPDYAHHKMRFDL